MDVGLGCTMVPFSYATFLGYCWEQGLFYVSLMKLFHFSLTNSMPPLIPIPGEDLFMKFKVRKRETFLNGRGKILCKQITQS